jgi:hypothetical protein
VFVWIAADWRITRWRDMGIRSEGEFVDHWFPQVMLRLAALDYFICPHLNARTMIFLLQYFSLLYKNRSVFITTHK